MELVDVLREAVESVDVEDVGKGAPRVTVNLPEEYINRLKQVKMLKGVPMRDQVRKGLNIYYSLMRIGLI